MTDTAISPLRQRMIEDMTVRGFTPGTQRGYIVAVRNFTAFLGRSPDEADAEDLRRYQLHMRSCGASATSMNAAVSALRFFFGVTLQRNDANAGMTTVREPNKLPVVGSVRKRDIERLLGRGAWAQVSGGVELALMERACAPPRWSRSRSVRTSTANAPSIRPVIRTSSRPFCKGRKDRYAMLPPTLLDLLHGRKIEVAGRPVSQRPVRNQRSRAGGSFRVTNPGQSAHHSPATVQRTFHGAREAAGIESSASPCTTLQALRIRTPISWSRRSTSG